MKTALIYMRSDQGIQKGDVDLASQLMDLTKVLRTGLVKIQGTYFDIGVSVEKMDRPGLSSLINEVNRLKPDYVFVTKYDRLTDLGTSLDALEASFGDTVIIPVAQPFAAIGRTLMKGIADLVRGRDTPRARSVKDQLKSGINRDKEDQS